MPITNMFLISKPRKTSLIDLILILNLFLARPKSATVKRRGSDSSTTSTRSRLGGSISARSGASNSAGNYIQIYRDV